MAKDNFSMQSPEYAAYRPVFPDALYAFVLQQLDSFDLAWDVATGNGQSAVKLAPHFRKVIATDISRRQIEHATQLANIEYRVEPAEQSSLENNSVDLVTISQALHWMDFEPFYEEVKRVAKPGAVVAAFVYGLLELDDAVVNEIISNFYFIDSAPYWDAERRWVDEAYKGIPFPFRLIDAPLFGMEYQWRMAEVLAYMRTWSACQHFQKQTGRNLVDEKLLPVLRSFDMEMTVRVQFPVYTRIGKV